ncbi:hypothetical protein JCM6882_003334 [Rhodosporidiobolus microsporus]
MSAATAPAPTIAASFPCPYTAGGCPLFNTIDLPPNSPRCAGSCGPSEPAPPPRASSSATPSASTSSSTPSSAATTPFIAPTVSRPIAYDENALLFSELQSDVPLPLPSALLKQDAWSSYLDYSVSPGQVELPSYFVPPLPAPASVSNASSNCAGSVKPGLTTQPSHKHNLWDIEELVPPGASTKRTRLTPPPGSLAAAAAAAAVGYGDLPVAGGSGYGSVETHSPPLSSDEEKEVITPFISKLTYLLEHEEYRPWVRWDATGNHILIAHTKPHLLEILARYFRHTTVASFVRQLNIYGFKRASTSSLLSILETVSFPSSVVVPGHPEPETFSAADYSAFSNPAFFRSVPGGRHCRLGSLKPITKERGPRNRSKKAQAKRKVESDGDSA